jgi:hypothetical protein
MQLSARNLTRHKAATQPQEVLVKRQVQFIVVAASLAAATLVSTSPAAAYTPVFMKYCGVDGESSAPAAKPERKPTKPDRKAVSVAAPDARSDARPAPAPAREVKKPDSKPAPGLLLPAIQKAH